MTILRWSGAVAAAGLAIGLGGAQAARDGMRPVSSPLIPPPRGVQLDIYAMRSDGSARRSLTNDKGDDGSPAWSPNGTRIAAASGADIVVMDPAGRNRRNLTHSDHTEDDPAWAPDGRRLAFVRRGAGPGSGLYVSSVSGKGVHQVGPTFDFIFGPDWAPDGRWIAFAARVERQFDIFLIDPGGGPPMNVTNSPADDLDPSWSPNGRRLAFSSTRGGTDDIFTIAADGTNLRQVTDPALARDEGQPDWSRDGTRIVFSARRALAPSDIFVTKLDGTGVTNLTGDSRYSESQPSWSSDGKRIAYTNYGRPVCEVPNVLGRRLRVARDLIRGSNCSVARVTRVRAKRARGVVLRQNPGAGTHLRNLGRVTLVVSR